MDSPPLRPLPRFIVWPLCPAYFIALAISGVLMLLGIAAAYYMETQGHHVTGMSNQIVWGLPHVFAILMILVSSGALNAASISSVFGRSEYKPLARLSGLVSIAFLLGGLAVLVLDLGRPDRLIVAMTYYNFKSIFAWNIFLYIGFMLVVIAYLWMLFERRMAPYSRMVGMAAFLWRLILTTGTGSIFGFLVARQAYDEAVMAPLFILTSFVLGYAAFILVLLSASYAVHCRIGEYMMAKMRRLLGVFLAGLLYFVLVYHLTNLYAAEHHGVEAFFLRDGGVYTLLFWLVQLGLGSVLPLILLFAVPFNRSRSALVLACALILIGGIAQLYVIIIGGQAYPLVMFPGMEESSSFFDGVVAEYTPSLPEFLLSIGGLAMAVAVIVFMLAVLDFLPARLSDQDLKPGGE